MRVVNYVIWQACMSDAVRHCATRRQHTVLPPCDTAMHSAFKGTSPRLLAVQLHKSMRDVRPVKDERFLRINLVNDVDSRKPRS